jgi:hypothetical protein
MDTVYGMCSLRVIRVPFSPHGCLRLLALLGGDPPCRGVGLSLIARLPNLMAYEAWHDGCERCETDPYSPSDMRVYA